MFELHIAPLSSSGGHQTGSFMNLCIFILSDKCFWTRDTSDCLSLTAVSQCFLAQLCPCAPPLPSFITHSAWSHLKFPPESLPQLNDALLSEGNFIKHLWRPKVRDICEMIFWAVCDGGDVQRTRRRGAPSSVHINRVILRIRTGFTTRWDKSS